VSRTPVRQAFVQLEAEDLLDLYPRRGALVVPISPSEADDVLEARLLLEQHCARRAATAGPWLAADLNEVLTAQESALGAGYPEFTTLDRTFHRIIVAAAGNKLLTRQYDTLRDRHRRLTATTVAQDPTRIARFIAEHRNIAAALERGDADAAAELTARHLYGAHEFARRPRR
jgi:DNA-binding GntR family transcriptional regulator